MTQKEKEKILLDGLKLKVGDTVRLLKPYDNDYYIIKEDIGNYYLYCKEGSNYYRYGIDRLIYCGFLKYLPNLRFSVFLIRIQLYFPW